MPDVTITVDGNKLTAPAGTLLIEACKSVGIEVPSFCYYPGLSLQAACRMCLVEIEKMPKMQTACTVPITDGMVVRTDTEKVKQARKYLSEGSKVKVSVLFRGRAITHPEVGKSLLEKVVEQLGADAVVEQYPKMEGRSMQLVLSPPASKAKAVEKPSAVAAPAASRAPVKAPRPG